MMSAGAESRTKGATFESRRSAGSVKRSRLGGGGAGKNFFAVLPSQICTVFSGISDSSTEEQVCVVAGIGRMGPITLTNTSQVGFARVEAYE